METKMRMQTASALLKRYEQQPEVVTLHVPPDPHRHDRDVTSARLHACQKLCVNSVNTGNCRGAGVIKVGMVSSSYR
jgi:hypothetical protein